MGDLRFKKWVFLELGCLSIDKENTYREREWLLYDIEIFAKFFLPLFFYRNDLEWMRILFETE